MKTPWKFLAELTSRRRAAKEQESSIGHDTDPAALDHESEKTPAPPSIEVPASARYSKAVLVEQVASSLAEKQDGGEAVQASPPPVDGDDVWTPTPSEARRSDASALGPNETSIKVRRGPPPSRRERTKGAEANVTARGAAAKREGQSVSPSSARDAFFDNVVSLDEDIKKLRSELARKLQLQNAQLKTMLKRFDVS
ncbi:hypothetical protein ABID08_005801 [Rhizobium binae]|uniref:Uncharacterized protein n=1 Tax=Rhizobium binae TaxID=1138190 RepID=A0ABV2MQJ0_9HYPH|nr:hypothetical protein [Rhizobium binae]MBX4971018.1 hypothetical protein [Rhizobium binae]MBX4994943.1 hypothetical protein [Rhizobium binae]NKL52572.1 hypothetical protein [Rhizobium leguminosarum bv. viciae]QSY85028.1 hypothetical protein J2J99_25985 [Rhizobium binae]